tara:strand:+ start:383 stop:487 length:105 start_codon:yes stop_codon:yes gene_type:complete
MPVENLKSASGIREKNARSAAKPTDVKESKSINK